MDSATVATWAGSVVTMAGLLGEGWRRLSGKVADLKEKAAAQKEINDAVNTRLTNIESTVHDGFRDTGAKLDRLIDHMLSSKEKPA